MTKLKTLSVRLYGVPVGTLQQDKVGKMRFEYLENVSHALSVSMPLDRRRYGNMPCEIYFGGLLPESTEARRAIGQMFDANPNSTFSLLRAIGSDCAGAVSFHPPEHPVVEDGSHEIRVKRVSDEELEQHIRELPQKPLFIDLDGLRLSLAGVQEKAAVCIVDNEVCLPEDGTPTTHILKPKVKEDYPASVQNEYLCLRTAARVGLNVPNVEIRRAGAELYLLVERYDRKFDERNRIRRIHQEDFCQALGQRQKYQRFGGPGFKACFDLLIKSRIPVIDRMSLMQSVVFNFVIGNADAHGKNFAVLYDSQGRFRLAPFYDILCTQVYEALTQDMCMKVGGHYNFKDVTGDDWKQFSEEVKISFPVLKRLVFEKAGPIATALAEERRLLKGTEFDTEVADRMVDQVFKNMSRLVQTLS